MLVLVLVLEEEGIEEYLFWEVCMLKFKLKEVVLERCIMFDYYGDSVYILLFFYFLIIIKKY